MFENRKERNGIRKLQRKDRRKNKSVENRGKEQLLYDGERRVFQKNDGVSSSQALRPSSYNHCQEKQEKFRAIKQHDIFKNVPALFTYFTRSSLFSSIRNSILFLIFSLQKFNTISFSILPSLKFSHYFQASCSRRVFILFKAKACTPPNDFPKIFFPAFSSIKRKFEIRRIFY